MILTLRRLAAVADPASRPGASLEDDRRGDCAHACVGRAALSWGYLSRIPTVPTL